jgi:lipoxygenase
VLHTLIPAIKASISADNQDFSSFSDIGVLYKEGLLLKVGWQDEIWKNLPLLKAVNKIQESGEGQLKYDTPKILSSECIPC